MKKLVIYYSLDGNTKFLAETIANKLEAELLEIKLSKSLKTNNVLRYIKACVQAAFDKKAELEQHDIKVKDYDLVAIGSPVWAGSCTPAINSFLNSVDLSNKKIILFCSMAGDPGKVFLDMRKNIVNNIIISEKAFKSPLKNSNTILQDINNWLENEIQPELDEKK